MKDISRKARIDNETINVDGKMLVGQDLFDYVFRRKQQREDRMRDYGEEPNPYDCGG